MILHKTVFFLIFFVNCFLRRGIYISCLKFDPLSSNVAQDHDFTKLESTIHQDASTQVTDLSVKRFSDELFKRFYSIVKIGPLLLPNFTSGNRNLNKL